MIGLVGLQRNQKKVRVLRGVFVCGAFSCAILGLVCFLSLNKLWSSSVVCVNVCVAEEH